jgi:exodeoxyribonuclease VII large subunit
MIMPEKLSLSELQLIIRDSLYMALPDFYWVIAEISEISENHSGHCYIELIEKHSDEQHVRAKVKAIIWSKRNRFLKSFFENVTGETLREGLKILVKVKIEYSELYGLSLIICDINPAFTLGELAMKRHAIIRRLEKDGVFSMNKELDFPLLPQRIAIISSRSAAGYTDFVNHLNSNRDRYIFYPVLFETPMQGAGMENGIISALDRISVNSGLFDVVVLIRGGGSQSDLSWFDNYDIAFHVTQFPLPVITGIGHDKDESITDMVAYKSLKTPTAVADYILFCTSEAERHLVELSSSITETCHGIIEKNINIIDSLLLRLGPSVKLMVSGIKEDLSSKVLRIINTGKEYIVRAGLSPASQKSRLINSLKTYSSSRDSELKRKKYDLMSFTTSLLKRHYLRVSGLEKIIGFVKPENVLARGYTITSINGMIIKSKDLLKPGDIIDTQFIDGKITSRITDPDNELIN